MRDVLLCGGTYGNRTISEVTEASKAGLHPVTQIFSCAHTEVISITSSRGTVRSFRPGARFVVLLRAHLNSDDSTTRK